MNNALGWPGILWLLTFFLCPLLFILYVSFASVNQFGIISYWPPTLGNYQKLFDFLYVDIFLRSFRYAAITTIICLIIGYPLAWFIASQKSTWKKNFCLLIVMFPFFTNIIARIYGWFIILRTEGALASLLGYFNLPNQLLNNEFAIYVGMAYTYLSYMILPLYSNLEQIDKNLLFACQDLGATLWQAFRKVIFPLSLPGVAGGCLLVFVPAICEFLVPKMLGGSKMSTLGIVLEEQFLGKMRLNWPFGSAITSVIIILVLGAFLAITMLNKYGKQKNV